MKNTSLLFFGLFGAFISNLPAQHNSTPVTIHSMSWLLGTWCQEREGKSYCEVWKQADQNTLEGISLMIIAEDTLVLEHLTIQEVAGRLMYIAAPRGQDMTGFALDVQRGDTWIFENKEHDFPNRILYEKPKADILRARIEGKRGGELKMLTFEWQRQPGNAIDSIISNKNFMGDKKKVTGVGGIFFKSKNPENIKAWYAEHLGLITNEYGSLFEFRHSEKPETKGYLQWSPFAEKTKYFEPSEKEFMINFRVENIESLVAELKAAGVQVLDEIESYSYGKFVHIMDPEGNKIELWEPVDQVFTEMYEGKTTH